MRGELFFRNPDGKVIVSDVKLTSEGVVVEYYNPYSPDQIYESLYDKWKEMRFQPIQCCGRL